ncbi:MAG: hypothetical protein KJI72_00210 [Patescibacteria group bacterium]|nr:hypothetical protein [Patescibacteria group bacterium]
MRSLYDAIKFVTTLVAASRTADANGAAVDTQGFNSAVAVIDVGVVDETTGDETYLFKVQESDTSGGSYADVTGASLTVTVANDNKAHKIRIVGIGSNRKRWLRVILDVAGTTPICPSSVVIALGRAYQEPLA